VQLCAAPATGPATNQLLRSAVNAILPCTRVYARSTTRFVWCTVWCVYKYRRRTLLDSPEYTILRRQSERVIYHVVLVASATPVRSPPYSSSTTSRLPLGFSHDRGTWYLKTYALEEIENVLVHFACSRAYHLCDRSPQLDMHRFWRYVPA
jgi:hypothetical protein